MTNWFKSLFGNKVIRNLHEISLHVDKAIDENSGKQDESIQRIKQITKQATLAQSGNCTVKKLLKDIG